MGSMPVKYIVVSTEQLPGAPASPTMTLASINTLDVTVNVTAVSGLSGAHAVLQSSLDWGKTWTTQQTLSISATGLLTFTTVISPTYPLVQVTYSTTTGTLTSVTTITAVGTM